MKKNQNNAAAATAQKNGEKKQTAKAHEVMKVKMTREQFAEIWNDKTGFPSLYEVKTMTAKAKDALTGDIPNTCHDISIKLDGGGVTLVSARYFYRRNGIYATIRCIIEVNGNEVWDSKYIKCGRFNNTKVSFDYDALNIFLFNVSFQMGQIDLDSEREVTVRLVRNGKGGYDMIVPAGIKINEVRYE